MQQVSRMRVLLLFRRVWLSFPDGCLEFRTVLTFPAESFKEEAVPGEGIEGASELLPFPFSDESS